MTLIIESATCDRLARELAEITGESIDVAVTKALEVRLAQERRQREPMPRQARETRIREILERMRGAPVLDGRHPDEILGYNELGTWD